MDFGKQFSKMQERKLVNCQNPTCKNTFRITTGSTKIACCDFCMDKINELKGNVECQNHGIKTKMVGSGMTEHGDQKSPSKSVLKNTGPNTKPISIDQRNQSGIKSEERTILSSGKENVLQQNDTMKQTNLKNQPEKKNTLHETEKRSEHTAGSYMTETENKMPVKQKSESTEIIPQSDSSLLSMTLRRENENSIALLDNSAKHLVTIAETLVSPKKVDYEGNIIQRSTSVDIDTAVRCLSEARSLMKTKLEFLKFGHQLIKENS